MFPIVPSAHDVMRESLAPKVLIGKHKQRTNIAFVQYVYRLLFSPLRESDIIFQLKLFECSVSTFGSYFLMTGRWLALSN